MLRSYVDSSGQNDHQKQSRMLKMIEIVIKKLYLCTWKTIIEASNTEKVVQLLQ